MSFDPDPDDENDERDADGVAEQTTDDNPGILPTPIVTRRAVPIR